MSREAPGRRAGGTAFENSTTTLPETDPHRVRTDEREGAVVLLSGGLDSATVLAIARARGIDCHALTVDYGQRHRVELEAAREVAMQLGAASHRIVSVDLRALGGSALTDDDIDVPRPQSHDSIGQGIPATYVPARNTVLLALALAWAEILEVTDIYIGASIRDYSGYPDCRPEFLRAFERLADLGTRAGSEEKRRFRVHAPLVDKSKVDIIYKGCELGVNYALTHSCYDPTPEGLACGICDACILRRRGFQDAGVEDPTRYAGSD